MTMNRSVAALGVAVVLVALCIRQVEGELLTELFGCRDGTVDIYGRCFSWWVVAGIAAGAVAFLVLITGCCCCCCRCCRSSPPQGAQIMTVTVPGQPMVVGQTHGNGIHAVENPGYGQQYRPVQMQGFP